MKKSFFISIFFIFFLGAPVLSQNIDNLLTATQWNQLFPNRAGMAAGHPQGYTSDFYSFANLKQAINEMGDYSVKIRKKANVWGELTTVTKKSTNTTYNYSQVDNAWYANPTAETVVQVDFADFVNTSNQTNNKRELAAFLANISKETTGGWQTPVGGGTGGDYAKWGLYFVYELGYNASNGAGAYTQVSAEYPPNPAKGYYGRGPIQLSWNYNYGQFSKFLYNDVSVLLNNPDLVQQNGVLAFKSAIWFWMMPQLPKPSCHQVMHDMWIAAPNTYTMSKMYLKGFAHTNNIINGGLECRGASSSAYTVKVTLRSDLYKFYLKILGFTTAQVAAEDSGNYTTLCYQNTNNAMQNYLNGSIGTLLSSNSFDTEHFHFYPNPTVDFIRIDYTKNIDKISVHTLSGDLVRTAEPHSHHAEVDIRDLPEGMYIVQLHAQNDFGVFKVLKR